jgi:hypothetical protein
VPLKERKFFPSVPNASKVKIVSALISWSPASIALPKGNLISLMVRSHVLIKLIPNMQSSSPQVPDFCSFCFPLWISKVIGFPIKVLSTELIEMIDMG